MESTYNAHRLSSIIIPTATLWFPAARPATNKSVSSSKRSIIVRPIKQRASSGICWRRRAWMLSTFNCMWPTGTKHHTKNLVGYYNSAGNNSRSSDIVRPNFENVRPSSLYDRTRWPNMSPAHLASSSRCCQSISYVRSNLSNVRHKGRFERTYVLWIKKNYFQHCIR